MGLQRAHEPGTHYSLLDGCLHWGVTVRATIQNRGCPKIFGRRKGREEERRVKCNWKEHFRVVIFELLYVYRLNCFKLFMHFLLFCKITTIFVARLKITNCSVKRFQIFQNHCVLSNKMDIRMFENGMK